MIQNMIQSCAAFKLVKTSLIKWNDAGLGSKFFILSCVWGVFLFLFAKMHPKSRWSEVMLFRCRGCSRGSAVGGLPLSPSGCYTLYVS